MSAEQNQEQEEVTMIVTEGKRKTDETSDEEIHQVQPLAKKKFVLPSLKAKRDGWSLPNELADFFKERCQQYLGEKDLEEFLETPVPSNINTPTKLDPFMRVLLEKKNLNKVISVDDEMAKIHSRLFDLMGPLGKAWTDMQACVGDDGEDPDPADILKLLNQSVVIVGQLTNKVAYERRLAVLGALNDIKGAKRQLKDHQEDISEEEKLLFGELFQKHVKTVTKAQESAEKLFAKSHSSTSTGSWRRRTGAA